MTNAARSDRPDAPAAGRLHDELERLLADYFGRERRIESLSCRGSAFASSHAMDEVDVVLEDGTELQLVAKDIGARGMLEVARRARPAFLQDPLREAGLYRLALAGVGDLAPTGYGTISPGPRRPPRLVLERITGLELRRVGDLDVWKRATCRLAALHGRIADQVDLLPSKSVPPLVQYDREHYWRWLERAADSLSQAGATRPLARLTTGYGRIIDHLVSLPRIVIHGDCFPSNVLVAGEADRERICFVDWELAGRGPGLVDLAALVSGGWTDRDREELLEAYRDGLPASGQSAPSLDEMMRSLDVCRLHLAVRMLGWSDDWEPPSEQRQDWLSEALQLAGLLDL